MEDFLVLIQETRQELEDAHGLHGSFVDYCDLACELLSKKLKALGIKGKLCRGSVEPAFESPRFHGHDWIEVGTTVLDPTSDQFDFKEMVFSRSHGQYKRYHLDSSRDF